MVAKIVNQKVAELFDRRGGSYSDAWASVAKRRLSRFETNLVREAVEAVLQNSGNEQIKVLDIGIGTGRIARALLDYDVEYHGIDISQVMVDYCREKFKNNEKVRRLAIHDIVNPLPEDWGKFDAVSAIRVLSYSPLWPKAVRNIYEALKPGGVLVFTSPNKYSSAFLPMLVFTQVHQGGDTSYDELERAVMDAGFSECQITGFARLLDVFYDWCNSNLSANILFSVERFLRAIFGPTRFARLFYVTCKK